MMKDLQQIINNKVVTVTEEAVDVRVPIQTTMK